MKFWRSKNKKRNPKLMEGQSDYTFRRSRTITGTTAPRVAASTAERGQLKTDRIKQMEFRQLRRQILRTLAGILVVAGFLALLVQSFILTPSITFAQKGVKAPPADGYKQSFNAYFDTHPFERFSFLLRPDMLEKQIVHDHPEVLGITYSHNLLGGSSEFAVALRKPLLAWQSGARKFYVDSQGVAFTFNGFSEPKLAVSDQSGVAPEQTGGVVASTRFVRFLGQLVNAVNGYNLGTVESVIIPPSLRELDIKLKGRGYVIKTNTDRDPNQEAEDLANALKYFDSKKMSPEYVDVRVAHKAFYK